jgi:hypothetical protein
MKCKGEESDSVQKEQPSETNAATSSIILNRMCTALHYIETETCFVLKDSCRDAFFGLITLPVEGRKERQLDENIP